MVMLTWCDYLAREDLDGQPALVEVLDVKSAASERSEEVDLSVVVEVVALALEARVRLLLNLKLHVAWLDAGHLVTLSSEVDLGASLHALVDVDVEHLALDNGLLAGALLALVLLADLLALTVAVGADGLEALDHGTHLAHHGLHALALAALASLHGTLLAAAAVTLGADDALLQSKLGNLATVDVLERDLVNVVNGARLLGARIAASATKHAAHATESSTSTAATEELCEQILSSHASTAAHSAALLEALLAILVVDLALLRVREDFVCV
jgi:hypothetical protein